jgi:Predicted signal transduction protein with a C-terminal ATPase domain
VLENMAELFRGLMNENRQLVRLDEEVNLCLNYLEIEQIRLGERLKVTWKIEAMPANALVPPLMLQPLIENAVYHGVEPLGEPGEISVEIVERGRELVITLINPIPSGQEYSNSATHNQGNRMAISNIRERLQLHFDAEARLKTDTENGLYRVTIVLPNLDREP